MLFEEMQKQGSWLFRHRSYLPLVLVLLGVLAMLKGEALERWDTLEAIYCSLSILIALLGFYIRIITIGHVPQRTSGRNTKAQVADTLNTTGMYSVSRNPLYLGNFLMWLGIVLYTQSWWFVLTFLVLFALYYERIIMAEEAFLREKFGQTYADWAARTPAFFPRGSLWRKPALPFSLRLVLRREYSGAFALAVCLSFVEVVGDFFEEGHFELELAWMIPLAVTAVLYVVLRTLKKRHLLDVEGR